MIHVSPASDGDFILNGSFTVSSRWLKSIKNGFVAGQKMCTAYAHPFFFSIVLFWRRSVLTDSSMTLWFMIKMVTFLTDNRFTAKTNQMGYLVLKVCVFLNSTSRRWNTDDLEFSAFLYYTYSRYFIQIVQ